MKQVMFFLCLLSLISLNAAGNITDIHLRKNLEIWFTSAPGAPDMIDMFTEYDYPRFQWSHSRQYLTGIKFYQGQITINPFPFVSSNTYNNLSRSNVFWIINKRFKQKIAAEVGAIKDHNCLNTQEKMDRNVNETVEAGLNIYRAGGQLFSFDIDTSFGPCEDYNTNGSAIITAHWSMLVEYRLNQRLAEMKFKDPTIEIIPVKFRDIEPYPSNSIRKHKDYIQKLNSERIAKGYAPIDAYYIDIDHHLVSDEKIQRDIKTFIVFLQNQGIKAGLIINGDDPKPENIYLANKEYLDSANKRLGRFKRLGLLDNIDIIMIQSWAAHMGKFEKRYIPYNVPENEITHTNFLLHVLRCISDTTDCDTYPE